MFQWLIFNYIRTPFFLLRREMSFLSYSEDLAGKGPKKNRDCSIARSRDWKVQSILETTSIIFSPRDAFRASASLSSNFRDSSERREPVSAVGKKKNRQTAKAPASFPTWTRIMEVRSVSSYVERRRRGINLRPQFCIPLAGRSLGVVIDAPNLWPCVAQPLNPYRNPFTRLFPRRSSVISYIFLTRRPSPLPPRVLRIGCNYGERKSFDPARKRLLPRLLSSLDCWRPHHPACSFVRTMSRSYDAHERTQRIRAVSFLVAYTIGDIN